MFNSRLIASFKPTMVGAAITDYIQMVAKAEYKESYKTITDIFVRAEAAAEEGLVEAGKAWQELQNVADKLLSLSARKEVTPEIYEKVIQAVAQQLQAINVSENNLDTIRLLICLFKGIQQRNLQQDEAGKSKWNVEAYVVTQFLDNFNKKNRTENLAPIMGAVSALETKCKTILDQQAAEAKAKADQGLSGSIEELESLQVNISAEMLRYNIQYREILNSLSATPSHTVTPEESRDVLLDKLSQLQRVLSNQVEQLSKIDRAIQDAMNVKSQRLKDLTENIKAKLSQGKVIPYDEELANYYGLNQEQKAVWKERASQDLRSGYDMVGLFNRFTEASTKVHAIPVFGYVTKKVSSLIWQAEAKKKPHHNDVMQHLHDVIYTQIQHENDFAKIKSADIQDLQEDGRELIRGINDFVEGDIKKLQADLNEYIVRNDKFIHRLLRAAIGYGRTAYQVALTLQKGLEKATLIDGAETLRTILNAEKPKLAEQRSAKKLVAILDKVSPEQMSTSNPPASPRQARLGSKGASN